MDIILIAILSAIGFIIIMFKVGIHNFTKHSVKTDIIISSVLAILFIGTFSGMATALIAGIFVSLFLSISKLLFGTGK